MADLCDRLRTLRRERNLKQQDMADRFGQSLRAYQYYEAGTRRPEYQHLLDRSNWDKALQYLALMNQSHPFLSVRAAEINNWCKTRAYENIIAYIHEEGGDRCPVCGTVIQEEWMFCRQCGTKLK